MQPPKGYTLVEVVVTLGILGVLFGVAGISLAKLQDSIATQTTDREITYILSSAARRARHGARGTDWGVYIPYDLTTRKTTSITVFSGESYATRNTAYDIVYTVSDEIAFTAVDFSGEAPAATNDQEIVFSAMSGQTADYGSVTLTWYGNVRTVTVDQDGFIVRQ